MAGPVVCKTFAKKKKRFQSLLHLEWRAGVDGLDVIPALERQVAHRSALTMGQQNRANSKNTMVTQVGRGRQIYIDSTYLQPEVESATSRTKGKHESHSPSYHHRVHARLQSFLFISLPNREQRRPYSHNKACCRSIFRVLSCHALSTAKSPPSYNTVL